MKRLRSQFWEKLLINGQMNKLTLYDHPMKPVGPLRSACALRKMWYRWGAASEILKEYSLTIEVKIHLQLNMEPLEGCKDVDYVCWCSKLFLVLSCQSITFRLAITFPSGWQKQYAKSYPSFFLTVIWVCHQIIIIRRRRNTGLMSSRG